MNPVPLTTAHVIALPPPAPGQRPIAVAIEIHRIKKLAVNLMPTFTDAPTRSLQILRHLCVTRPKRLATTRFGQSLPVHPQNPVTVSGYGSLPPVVNGLPFRLARYRRKASPPIAVKSNSLNPPSRLPALVVSAQGFLWYILHMRDPLFILQNIPFFCQWHYDTTKNEVKLMKYTNIVAGSWCAHQLLTNGREYP